MLGIGTQGDWLDLPLWSTVLIPETFRATS